MSGNIPSTRPSILGRPEASRVNSMRYAIALGVLATTSRSRGINAGSTKPARIVRWEASSSTSRNRRVLADSRISHQTPAAEADITASSVPRIVKSPCFPCQNVWQKPAQRLDFGRGTHQARCQCRLPPAISDGHHEANYGPPMHRLVLGSRSLSRRKLLARLSIPFLVVHPDIDESALDGETPDTLVRRLSEQKARAVGAQVGTGLVIGSDQIALLDDTVLGKPGNHANNVDQLAMASGRWLEFRTGIAVLDAASSRVETDIVHFAVKFRSLSTDDIEAYVSHERAYNCAGGFRAERLGCALFECMRGDDPTALLGLPMIRMCEMLQSAGLDVLRAPRNSRASASANQSS